MKVNIKQIKRNLLNKKASRIRNFEVMTDRIDYKEKDQVFPLHPEHHFFLNEMDYEEMRRAWWVLDIGLGSGVLSIAAAHAGAQSIVGLEINPRAIAFAGYNFITNGVEDRIEIRKGSKSIYSPVRGDVNNEQFDFIISNPPFEPTPPGLPYYLHSSGGRYGLDFLEKLLRGLKSHLVMNGHAQIVSFSPGTESEPFMLIDLVKKHMIGDTNIIVNPIAIPFDQFAQRFLNFGLSENMLKEYLSEAKKDGITHLHMCMIKILNHGSHISVKPSERAYERWDLPLGSDIPTGFEEELPFGTNTPKFTIKFNSRWDIDEVHAGKCNNEGPRERLGKLIQICQSMEEADALLRELNSDWGEGRTFSELAFLLEVAPMVERDTFRTPKENEETVFLVIDRKG
jgi:SAM-dependent methyltransferase